MSKAEELFTAEAELRDAAEGYASWLNASNRTADALNKSRARLRAAAVRYAGLAQTLERGKP